MQPVELLGAPGSPYTRKMIALLRYRHIPYRILWGSHVQPPAGYPAPKVKLLPTVYFGEGEAREAMVDSTPIIRRLEREHAPRSVIPENDLLRFLDLLIEDFADEWMTKAMFHYRWEYLEDAANAGPLLIFWQDPRFDDATADKMAQAFAKRQIDRLYVVGSNKVTGPVIEASYQRLVGILDRIVQRQGFVLGTRPSSADFAIYAQLSQLGIVDPTPARILAKASPRLRAWLDRVEDLSGQAGWRLAGTCCVGRPSWRTAGGDRPGVYALPARQRTGGNGRAAGVRDGDRRPALDAACVPLSSQMPAHPARGARRTAR